MTTEKFHAKESEKKLIRLCLRLELLFVVGHSPFGWIDSSVVVIIIVNSLLKTALVSSLTDWVNLL